jgi:RimJ/RimL family protein N-acetyltransferase
MLPQTDNLVIRPYQSGDLDRLYVILSDPITMRFWPSPLTLEASQLWIDRSIESYVLHGFGRYVVVHAATGELIGDCGILRSTVAGQVVNDLGYIIHHPHWGHGYATEAARAVKEYAFGTLGLDALHANMPWNHDASRRVAEKIGMRRIQEFDNQRNRNIRTLLYTVEADPQ